jgi:aminoglycoside phosphotransferase (APT) family kinase protein
VAESTLSADQVLAFVAERHGPGAAITDLEPLSGGFWSAAFGYRADGRRLVVRFGPHRDGFEADQRAMAHASADLPVPEVLEVGSAFDAAYAISVRHDGRFLEDVEPHEAGVVGPTLVRLLAALHARPAGPPDSGAWRRFLVDGFVDDAPTGARGWRAGIAVDPRLERLFTTCEAKVHELAAACPERRDVVHGDLLARNVLVNDDGSRVNAVFSWKCSVRGDFLYDVAWCTFWSHVAPGIAAVDVLGRVLRADWARADPSTLADAAVRHHCYELQIGATHLGWYVWTGDEEALERTAGHTEAILERGPVAAAG